MQADDAPPRLRWRLLAWLAGALLLLPVLYVAASGPLTWWYGHEYQQQKWMERYDDTLDPLREQPSIGSMLEKYNDWWFHLPAPRFMRRQYFIDQLTNQRVLVERTRKDIAEAQRRLAALRLRLDPLESRTALTPEQSGEAIGLRSEIAEEEDFLESYLRQRLPTLEKVEQEAERALREFDRGK